ncbi:2-dehydropantoate 2-reductase N-terminal domain-containing protein [Niabella yanshanensis]|uniref:2-dehydropantoate 2-reductase N-terminal domain-containing protein n=1 Tax=Niabella yanshanensis TaxID=577386 RepID=A0ABZ0W650_9BACT|nr:2-dehydropantoate 2-reductase N-terminal domain-containing protein [Niabella yanshanensis]WQD38778.1 2-dehydropantoate 2-reductase N-terminal domain-containing protein [Niabella yanshanensis]
MLKGKVGIIGCGWLGYRIARHLSNDYEIHTTVTTENKVELLRAEGFHPEIVNFETHNRESQQSPWQKLSHLDHIIITVPIFSKRAEQQVLNTRIRNLSGFILKFEGTLILMSSIGVYKDLTGEVTEERLPAENCTGEKEIKQLFKQVNILRLGGLMGDERLLHKYKVADLDTEVNHIHFLDICKVVELLIVNATRSGLYNLVAPLHPSKRAVINWQTELNVLPLPKPGGKLVLSQKITDEMGYEFVYPDPRYFHISNHPTE